ncbi:MAG TPA: methyltransferase domain-containing protein [Vicinamibacterales bacterium]|nr:methyltransferase domain-containing protein [Vicinamibacterales bacterium]
MTRRSLIGHVLATLLVTQLVPAAAAAQRSGSTVAVDEIFEAIGVREGVTVCEIGAGDGELSMAAARAVGRGGRVYTSELGETRVASLKERVSESGPAQITVVAGDPSKANFPEAACDALFMRNVYHHFADPGAMNKSIAAALKPGGRVAIVDFTPPGAEAADAADRDEDGMHGVTPESVSRELKDAGLEPVSSERGGDRWFIVVASKPKRHAGGLTPRQTP